MARLEMEITAIFPLASGIGSEETLANTGEAAEFAIMLGSVADPPPIPPVPPPSAAPTGEGVANPGPIAQPQRPDLLPSQGEGDRSLADLAPSAHDASEKADEESAGSEASHVHDLAVPASQLGAAALATTPHSPSPLPPPPPPGTAAAIPEIATSTANPGPVSPDLPMIVASEEAGPVQAPRPSVVKDLLLQRTPYGRAVALDRADEKAEIGRKFFAVAEVSDVPFGPVQDPLAGKRLHGDAQQAPVSAKPPMSSLEVEHPTQSPPSLRGVQPPRATMPQDLPEHSGATQSVPPKPGDPSPQHGRVPFVSTTIHVPNDGVASQIDRAAAATLHPSDVPLGTPAAIQAVRTSAKAGGEMSQEAPPEGDVPTVAATPVSADAAAKQTRPGTDRESRDPAPELAETEGLEDHALTTAPRINESDPRPLASDGASPMHLRKSITPGQLNVAIRQIIDRIEFLAARPREAITIHLRPEQLGTISMTVKAVGSAIDAQIAASEPAVRQALEQSQAHLAAGLEQRGYTLNQIQITQSAPTGSGPGLDAQARHQHDQTPMPQQRHQGQSTTHYSHASGAAHDLSRARQIARSATGVDLWI